MGHERQQLVQQSVAADALEERASPLDDVFRKNSGTGKSTIC